MDFSDISEYLPVIITVIGLIAVQFFMRRKNASPSSNQHIVHAFMSDIRINLRLLEVLVNGEQIKRFSVTGWKLHKGNTEFLNQNLQKILTETYEIAEDYNQQVASTKKFNTVNYIANIDTSKFKDRLSKARSGLEDWLMNNIGTTDPAGKSGMFDSLLGRR